MDHHLLFPGTLGTAAILAFASCSEYPGHRALVSEADSAAIRELAPPYGEQPPVCKSEFNCMAPEFGNHFRTGKGPMAPAIADVDKTVRTGAVQAIFTALPPNSLYGLRIHYGLDNSTPRKLELGLEPVELTERVELFYDVRPLGTIQRINGSGLDHAMTQAQWDSAYGDRYFQEVMVMRTYDAPANGWDHVSRARDHSSYILRHEDIKALIHDNRDGTVDPAYLHFCSMGDPIIRRSVTPPYKEDDWRHVIAIVTALGTAPNDRNLGDGGPQGSFIRKALDLGQGCPPGCDLAAFYRYGMKPRSGCGC